jgi:hypothetical protein
MKYTVQIFTGGWKNCLYQSKDIIYKLRDISKLIDIDKVIIGWNINKKLYEEIGQYLSSQGIEMYLWLPTFSEIGELGRTEAAIDLMGKKTENFALQEGETFEFYCPTSEANKVLLYSIYHEYFETCGFQGVFLDKIRNQSFVAGFMGVAGCCCSHCEDKYRQQKYELEQLRRLISEQGLSRAMEVKGFEHEEGFRFVEKEMQQFFDIKGEIITQSIFKITDHFKQMNLKIGMDVFAPALSQFVGQNLIKLSEKADFLKPMMYRKTMAPAGIGYEYEMLKTHLEDASSYDKALGNDNRLIDMSNSCFLQQLVELNKASHCPITPGIEINYQQDIVATSPQYVKDSLNTVEKSGCEGVVLSWDIMQAPKEHILVLKERVD